MQPISVISLSGGLDSTSLLLCLLNKKHKVFCLSFKYGQKHILEIDRAKANLEFLKSLNHNISHKIIDISSSISLLKSAITNNDIEVPTGHYKKENMIKTVVPNRNAIFTSFLYAYALSISNNNQIEISLGVHSGDHAIYPDCRPDFYKKIMDAFEIGNWNSKNISINLPFINFTKTQILQELINSCKNLEIDYIKILKNTLTSYLPNRNGVSNGDTGSDIERILAFHELGLTDPIQYTKTWDEIVNNALKYKAKQDD